MNKIKEALEKLPEGTIVQMPEKNYDELYNKDSDGTVLIEKIKLDNGVRVWRDP